MNKNLLLIFTRNPELGKVKTRLAKSVGDKTALDIYHFLLHKTKEATKNISCDKTVYYSKKIIKDDLWNRSNYHKKEQFGNDLGEKMKNAFQWAFKQGYEKVLIIGSDLWTLDENTLLKAQRTLVQSDFVIGPAYDGGYYLLGMKEPTPALFENNLQVMHSYLQSGLDGGPLPLLPGEPDFRSWCKT